MPIVTFAPRATSFCSGGMPTGSASACRNFAAALASGDDEGGGPDGMRVRSIGRRVATFAVPQLTMNSWVCVIGLLLGLSRKR